MNTKLPVFEHKEEIINSVKNNDITIISAETGSGKSTQVPQYLLKDGYRVVVTEPRRIAAVSLAGRVSEEILKDTEMREFWENSEIVGYRTGFEHTDTEDTKILFCTDGLKVARGMSQSNDTVLVIDEVHEWNLNIETLVAWVKHWNSPEESVKHNKIKVVVMSATMDSESLKEFYKGNSVEVINCSGTLYNVEMYDKPEYELVDTIVGLYNMGSNVLVFEPGKAEIGKVMEDLRERLGNNALILPMHSELSIEEQRAAFKSYSCNKIVVATNIAQTSITIPDIDAVVDSGVEKVIDTRDGIEGLFPRNISKADCKQRAGRAGRTKEGVYYLCSNVKYEKRVEFTSPEIQRLVLDKVVLKLISVDIDPRTLEFYHEVKKWDIERSFEVLRAIKALSSEDRITEDGRAIAYMPISVRYGRMLLEAEKRGCLRDMISAVAIMEIGSMVNTRKIRANSWFEATYRYSDFTTESSSDVLAELEIYKNACNFKYPDLRESGINSKNFFRIKEMDSKLSFLMSKELESEVKREKVDREAIRYCIFCGYVDNIFVEQYHFDGCGYIDDKRNFYKLDKNSCVMSREAIAVGTPKIITFKDRYGFEKTLNLLTMCTVIPFELFMSVLGDEVTIEDDFNNANFNPYTGMFEGTRTYSYGDHVIHTKMITPKRDSAEYKELLDNMMSSPDFRENFYVMPSGSIKKINGYFDRYIEVYYNELSSISVCSDNRGNPLQVYCEGFKSNNAAILKKRIDDIAMEKAQKELEESFVAPTGSIETVQKDMFEECGERTLVDSVHNVEKTVYVGLNIVKNSVALKVFNKKDSSEESTQEALQFLVGRYVSQNYSDKKFYIVTNEGKKIKTKKSESVNAEFHKYCEDAIKEVSEDNFSDILEFIDESYKELVAVIC